MLGCKGAALHGEGSWGGPWLPRVQLLLQLARELPYLVRVVPWGDLVHRLLNFLADPHGCLLGGGGWGCLVTEGALLRVARVGEYDGRN